MQGGYNPKLRILKLSLRLTIPVCVCTQSAVNAFTHSNWECAAICQRTISCYLLSSFCRSPTIARQFTVRYQTGAFCKDTECREMKPTQDTWNSSLMQNERWRHFWRTSLTESFEVFFFFFQTRLEAMLDHSFYCTHTKTRSAKPQSQVANCADEETSSRPQCGVTQSQQPCRSQVRSGSSCQTPTQYVYKRIGLKHVFYLPKCVGSVEKRSLRPSSRSITRTPVQEKPFRGRFDCVRQSTELTRGFALFFSHGALLGDDNN